MLSALFSLPFEGNIAIGKRRLKRDPVIGPRKSIKQPASRLSGWIGIIAYLQIRSKRSMEAIILSFRTLQNLALLDTSRHLCKARTAVLAYSDRIS
jgi:hypothetical protein